MNRELRDLRRRGAIARSIAAGAAFVAIASSALAMKAGVASVAITPERDMWLAGYAARTEPSNGKTHDLFAKALALEDDAGGRVVFVSTDLLGLTREVSSGVADLVQASRGLPRAALVLSASHTHSGPVIRANLQDMYELDDEQWSRVVEYTDALPAKIASAVEAAIDDLEPCSLAWGLGRAGFAANRRQYTLDGVVIGVNPIGPTDHDVPVLAARRADGSTKAVVFSYACHNTTLALQLIGGDYAGFAQAWVERYAPGATALYMTGCAGDQNPDPRRTLDLAERHGAELGVAVVDALRNADHPVSGAIAASFAEIPLKLTPAPPREEIEAQLEDPNVYKRRRAKALLARLDAEGALPETYPYPVQTVRIGDSLTLVALGGEVVVDYSLRLKHELGRRGIFVLGYQNDVMAYVPSLRVLREGGYEGADSMVYYGLHGPWSREVEEDIVAEVRRQIGR